METMVEEQPHLERFEIHPYGRGLSRMELGIAAGSGAGALIAGLIAARYVGGLIAIALFWAPLALILFITWSVRRLSAKTLLLGGGAIQLKGARGTEFAVPISQIEFLALGRPATPHPKGPVVYLRGVDSEGESFEGQVPSGMTALPRFIRLLRAELGDKLLVGPASGILATYPEDERAWSRPFAAIAATASARQALLVDEAQQRIADSDYSGAIGSLRRAAGLYSRDAGLMATLGDALFLSGQFRPASAWYTRSLSLNPGAPGPSTGLGMVKYLTRDYTAAQSAFFEGSTGGKEGEVTQSLLACCMMMNSDFGSARRVFEGLSRDSKNAAMRKMASSCTSCVRSNEEYTSRLQMDEQFRKTEAARGTAGRALKTWAAIMYGILGLASPIIGRLFKGGKVASVVGTLLLMGAALISGLVARKPGGPTVALAKDKAAMCWTWLGPSTPLRQVVYKEYFRKPKASSTPTTRTIFGAASESKAE